MCLELDTDATRESLRLLQYYVRYISNYLRLATDRHYYIIQRQDCIHVTLLVDWRYFHSCHERGVE